MESKDVFANYAIISVTESAANTLTFKKLETGISLTEKVAWVVNRIEYIIGNWTSVLFTTTADSITFGLSLSNAFVSPEMTENTIVDYNQILVDIYGAATNAQYHQMPIVKDLSTLPGGGVLVPPAPLYLFAKSTGLAVAETITARLHYTLRTLKVDEYWELVEARRVLSS
jgi:hypothetical protein